MVSVRATRAAGMRHPGRHDRGHVRMNVSAACSERTIHSDLLARPRESQNVPAGWPRCVAARRVWQRIRRLHTDGAPIRVSV